MRSVLYILLLLVAVGGLFIITDPAQSQAAAAVPTNDVFSTPAPVPPLTASSPELTEVAVAPPKAPTTTWKPGCKTCPQQSCPDGTCPAVPDQTKPAKAKPDQAKPDQVKPDQARPDQVASPLPPIEDDTTTVKVRRGGPLARALSAWADKVRARRGHCCGG